MTTPTMTWTRLTRRLGSDHNPLRRRSDLIQAWLAPAALAAFLVLGTLATGAASMWIHADNAAVQQAQRSWRPVPAVLLRSTPGPMFTAGGANSWTTWAPARWAASGRRHTGWVPAAAGTRAGRPVVVWLDRSGNVQVPALTPGQVADRVAVAALIALTVLAVALGSLARLGRWLLDRRCLAAWETAWLATAPRWARG